MPCTTKCTTPAAPMRYDERGLVLGRKNHPGSKSRRGAEVAATLYTLIETCKLVDVDPRRYLQAATEAALRSEPVPLPHDLASSA